MLDKQEKAGIFQKRRGAIRWNIGNGSRNVRAGQGGQSGQPFIWACDTPSARSRR